jgi:response regulator RpfG family c-di-GMP phosphodiesterase
MSALALAAAPAGAPAATAPSRAVLVADDDETIRLALSRYLRGQGWAVETVGSGEAALDALVPGRHGLFLCDVRMTGLGGAGAIAQARERDPALAIVVLTAAGDAATARAAFLAGACDYLTKPVGLAALRAALDGALQARARAAGAPALRHAADAAAPRPPQRGAQRGALRAVSVQVADALVTAMEAKDEFVRGRSARVADLAAAIAAEIALDEDTIDDVRLAGRLHDVGYIGVREAVLRKPDALTPVEYAEVQRHVEIGLEILAPLRHLGGMLQAVADHHERWDGAGYPRGLAGEGISIGGRILAAADAYDALTSARAYRAAMAPAAALDYLATRVGAQFDAEVYAAMRRVVERGSALTFLE